MLRFNLLHLWVSVSYFYVPLIYIIFIRFVDELLVIKTYITQN